MGNQIRILLLLLIIGLTLTTSAQLDVAPTPRPAGNFVIPESVFVRAGPASSYTPIGALFAGDSVTPLNISPDLQWILIPYNRTVGWVERTLIDWEDQNALVFLPVLEANMTPTPRNPRPTVNPLLPTATPAGNYVLLNAAESAFVRAGPGRGYLRLGYLLSGDLVEPVARNDDTSWLMIRYEDEFIDGFAWIAWELVEWEDDEALADLPIIDMDNLTPTVTFTPSVTPSQTQTPTATLTSTLTPTVTASPTATASATPSITPSLTHTATVTPSLTTTPIATDTATATYTPQPTLTHTATLTNTSAPTLTDTATLTNTPAPTLTYTATNTVEPTSTSTPAPTLTHTATITPSLTPIDTATATDTPDPTATYTAEPTLTPTATVTDTVEPTVISIVEPSATATNTPEPTATDMPTDEPQPTATDTVGVDITPSATTDATLAALLIVSNTPTPTATTTATNTVTPSPTHTETLMPTEDVLILPETATPSATPVTPIAEDTPSVAPFPIPLEAIIGIVILLVVLTYVWLYLQSLAAVNRYESGFVIEQCPVCQRGELHVEQKQIRTVGIPRVRRTVRCNECRSLLREKGTRRWRYAVDRIENPTLYDRYNGKDITDNELERLHKGQKN